jgi:hypothetical protein
MLATTKSKEFSGEMKTFHCRFFSSSIRSSTSGSTSTSGVFNCFGHCSWREPKISYNFLLKEPAPKCSLVPIVTVWCQMWGFRNHNVVHYTATNMIVSQSWYQCRKLEMIMPLWQYWHSTIFIQPLTFLSRILEQEEMVCWRSWIDKEKEKSFPSPYSCQLLLQSLWFILSLSNLQSSSRWVMWYSFCCDMIEGDIVKCTYILCFYCRNKLFS